MNTVYCMENNFNTHNPWKKVLKKQWLNESCNLCTWFFKVICLNIKTRRKVGTVYSPLFDQEVKKIISLAIMSLNIWICDYELFYMTYVKSERKPLYKHNEQNLSFRPQAINSTKKIWTISYLKRSKRKRVLIIFHQMYLFLYMHIYTLSIDNLSSYINIKMPIYWCIIM